MILPDTNVWSETMKPIRNDAVLGWIDHHWDELALSAIVLAELRYGVAKLPEGQRKQSLSAHVDRIERHKASQIVPFDRPAATRYGLLMGEMRCAGTPLPILDGQIAAQALASACSLATRNVSDFERTGVTLLNPWKP